MTMVDARSWADTLARVVTEVFGPAVLAAGLLVVVAWHSASSAAEALVWGLVAVTMAAAVPLAYVVRGVRRGRWADHHVADRKSRRVPMLFGLVCITGLLVILIVADAPSELFALVAAMVAGVVMSAVITQWWKISVHTAVAAATATVFAMIFGPWWILASSLVALVAWSRIHLRKHTLAQTTAGAALGVVVTAIVFATFAMT